MENGGGIEEEGNMGDSQAQHGGIICVLQTEKNKFWMKILWKGGTIQRNENRLGYIESIHVQ